MEYINEILDYLRKDPVKNINMISFIENYPVYYADKIGYSVIVKGKSDRNWIYISSKSSWELKNIREKLDSNDRYFAVIEDWMLPILCTGKKIKWKLSTTRLFLPKNVIIPDNEYDTSNLKEKDACFMYINSEYKEYISVAYIKERIKRGLSSCMYNSRNLFAWGATQDDGAIGFLHVLPEYRSKGYGKCIVIDLVNKVRDQGKIPFAHIKENNINSMQLALNLGFVRDRVVNWVEII
ncbi:GNAT family N-acetyltransferase [Clostridium sp. LBM24168]